MQIKEMYSNYGKTLDEELLKQLSKIHLVIKSEIGKSGEFKYYPMTDEYMSIIKDKLRSYSITWDIKTKSKPIKKFGDYVFDEC